MVKPLFFPDGNIGKLAVSGIVNDIIAQGGRAKYISAVVIVEEGFLTTDFKKIIDSAAAEASRAGVEITCGDIKVVEPGGVDDLFITTAWIGEKINGLFQKKILPGDAVIVTGGIGEHGAAIFQARNNVLQKNRAIKNDTAALTGLYKTMKKFSEDIKFMRDSTRGGLAEVMLELSEMTGMSVEIYENDIPVAGWVKGLSYITGIDYLYLACERQMVLVCEDSRADKIVRSLQKDGFSGAAKISEIKKGAGTILKTKSGGARYLNPGDIAQIPRIC